MAVNKVVLGEDTLIDLTGDTVSADKLSKGITAHNMAGEPIVGTMEAGGGVPDNMVTTDTNQTITGTKTFSNIRLNSSITSGISDFSGNKILLVRTDLNPKKVDVGYNSHDLQLNSKHPVIVYDGNHIKTLATTDQIPTVEANPENPTQTLSSIKIGDVDYSVGGGGGSGYTFTDGLTETNGTVSWDLSDSIKNGDSGKYATRLGYMAGNYNDHIKASGYGAVAFGMPNTDGFTDIISSGKGSLAFGTKNGSAYGGGIAATGEGSLAHGVSGFTTGAGLDNKRAIIASGEGSHAEGYASPSYGGVIKATASGAHAEGGGTTASGYLSHAEGRGTIANHLAQHSAGRYNIPDDSTAEYYQYGNYAFIIGNGTSDTARSNALTVDWLGNVQASGTVIASNIPAPPSTDGEYNLHCSIVNGVPTYSWKAE